MIRAVIFDVNGTLSDLRRLGDRLAAVGGAPAVLPLWFARVLRDGFAVTAAGGFEPFRELAVRNLVGLLPNDRSPQNAYEDAAFVVDSMARLPVHPDVPDALRKLHGSGVRIATLTNGTVSVTEAILRRAALLDLVDTRLDVSQPRRWKPAGEAYSYALDRCRVAAAEALFVAAHPWDVVGASRVGLRAVWLNRDRMAWPFAERPGGEVQTLAGLADTWPLETGDAT